MDNVNLTEVELENEFDFLLDVVDGQNPDYVPVTDEDQIDAAEDRDIITRVFQRPADGTFHRVIWGYVYAPDSTEVPTVEVYEFFEVLPVERTVIDYVEASNEEIV